MEDQEFLELFQQATMLLREQTLQQLLAENQTYQQICWQEEEAEKQYLQIDLTEAQRAVIDHLLQQKEHSGLLYADHAYLAGIKTMLQLYRALHL